MRLVSKLRGEMEHSAEACSMSPQERFLRFLLEEKADLVVQRHVPAAAVAEPLWSERVICR